MISWGALHARLAASPIAHRLVHGTFWSLVGTILARGFSVAGSIVVARHLGKVSFGELGIIQSTILNLIIFVSYALGMTATKHIAEFRVSDPERAGRILALSGVTAIGAGVLLAGGLYGAADLIAGKFLAAPHLAGLLRIGGFYLFLSALNGAQTGALSGFEAFKAIARVNLVTGLATFACMVTGVMLNGLYGAVWGLVASTGVSWMMAHWELRREAAKCGVPMTLQGIGREVGVLMSFSVPAIFASVLNGPVNWICSAMLVNQPGGYAQMGTFNATNQWFALVLFLPGLLGQVVLPMLSESVGAGDEQRSNRIIKLSMVAIAATAIPLVVAGSCASPWLMSLYGNDFTASWPVLVISLVTAGLLAVQTPVNQALNAEGRLWTVFFMNLGWAMIFIGLNTLLIERGTIGFVTARLIAYLCLGGMSIMVFSRMSGGRKKVGVHGVL